MAKKTWKKIDDTFVRHVWECRVCKSQAKVYPNFYADAGTPICMTEGECEGDDMEYVRTEMLK